MFGCDVVGGVCGFLIDEFFLFGDVFYVELNE